MPVSDARNPYGAISVAHCAASAQTCYPRSPCRDVARRPWEDGAMRYAYCALRPWSWRIFTERRLAEARATRNEAPTRQRGREQSLRRLRRSGPRGACFRFGELPAPKLAWVVRRVRDGPALAGLLAAPNRVQAAAAGEARSDPIGLVGRPCHFLPHWCPDCNTPAISYCRPLFGQRNA
jgi:hypothetical protein